MGRNVSSTHHRALAVAEAEEESGDEAVPAAHVQDHAPLGHDLLHLLEERDALAQLLVVGLGVLRL